MSPSNNFNEIQVFDDATDDMDIIKTIIDVRNQEDGFYIVDIGDVIEKHRKWISKMPRVDPHFGTSRVNIYLPRSHAISIDLSKICLHWQRPKICEIRIVDVSCCPYFSDQMQS